MASPFFTIYWRRFFALLLFCGLSAVATQKSVEAYHAVTRRVLLIHSYSIWHLQNYNLLPSFRQTLNLTKAPYILEHLELDGQSLQAQEDLQKKLELYLPALQEGQYDSVITFNALAGSLLQKNLSRVHHGTAVIFCEPEDWDSSLRQIHPRQTAILSKPGLAENIYLCMQLFPRTRKIVLLLDQTREALKILQSLPLIDNLSPTVQLISLSSAQVSNAELFGLLGALEQNSVVLYHSWGKRPEANSPVQGDLVADICAATTAPVMVMREAFLPYNVIGGKICSEKEIGRRAGIILLSLFEGCDLSLLQAETIPRQIIFNWPQLEQRRIPFERLPPDAILRNRPLPVWLSQRYQIITVSIGLIAVLLSVAMTLSWHRRNQRRRNAIFAHLPIRFFVSDKNGNILFSELGNRELLDERKYRFDHISDLSDIDIEKVLNMIRRTIREATPGNLNFPFRGTWRSASFHKLPTQLFGRETVIWVSQNTSALHRSRREAQDSAERFLQTLKSIGDAVIVTDQQGRITIINNVAAKLTGWNEDECRGKAIEEVFQIVSYKDGKPAGSPVREVLQSQKIIELANHTDLISRSGERHHIADSAAPIFDGNGNITGTVLVFRDVTEQYQQQRQKEQLEKKQEKLIKQLNNFIESERVLNRCLSQIMLEMDFQRNIEHIFSALSQQFGCDRISIGHFNLQNNDFKPEHSWTAQGLQQAWEQESKLLRAFYPSVRKLFEQDSLLSIPDCRHSPFAPLPADASLKSLIAAPIMVHGVLWGVLSIAFLREQRDFTEIDENIIRSSCKIIALAHIQNKQHAAIRQADLEKKLILNNIQIPIWLYDANGNLLRVNTAVSRYFGIREILALEQAENVLFDETVPPAKRPLQQVIKTGKPASLETSVNHFDFLVTAEPVINSDGELVNIVECAVNITDINEGKRQQELAMKAALEADRTKSFFLATMSHEIRTPLNVVIGYSELLQQKKLDAEERDEYLRSIHYAGNALLQLINDILDLSKIEAGQMQIVESKTDFPAICGEICSLFKQTKAQGKVSLHLDVPAMPYLFVDQLRLRQVLLNLMGNAVKFTRQGDICLSAKFTPENESSGTLEFSVSDTGQGISPEDQQKLFIPFVRLAEQRGSDKPAPGTGLGLAISSRLIKQMGGEISVVSEPEKGSRFTVRIPNVAWSREQEELEPRSEIADTAERSQSLSFLIVDDLEMNLKVLSAMLTKCQVQVTAVTSAEKALQALDKGNFDLILTDMWMPKMNGAELAAEIRKNPAWQAIPIIAVTADIENHQNFQMQDFSGVILKPLTLKKIISLVSAFRDQQLHQFDGTLEIS